MDHYIPTLSLSTVILLLILCINGNVHSEQLHSSTPLLEFDSYHNYDEMTDFLTKFTEEYKTFTKMYSVGRSIKKRELWVVEVHNMVQNATSSVGIPQVKVIGNIHGNEPAGREVILHMIEYLVKSFIDGDQYIQWLLNNTKIHFMPSMNPDGFEMAREGVCSPGRGRDNYKQFDLNRNFPDFFRRNTKPVQPETEAVKSWLQNNTFILSASLHGGSLVANYPFDNTPEDIWAPLYKVLNDANSSEEVIMLWKKLPHVSVLSPPVSPTPDDDVFHYLATLYAKTHPTMHLGIPCKEGSKSFKDGAVNGASWYPITGGMQDYNYVKHGCMEITLEISCCRYPFASELKQIWDENRQALLTFISQAQRGIRGIIRNKDGQPIPKASLRIIGRNMTFNTSKTGEFWRILLPGSYLLQVEAEGYIDKITAVSVPKVTNETVPVNNFVELTLDPVVKSIGSGSKTVRRKSHNIFNVSDPKLTNKSAATFFASNLTALNETFMVVGSNNEESDSKEISLSNESTYEIHLVVVQVDRSDGIIVCHSVVVLVLCSLWWMFFLW